MNVSVHAEQYSNKPYLRFILQQQNNRSERERVTMSEVLDVQLECLRPHERENKLLTCK